MDFRYNGISSQIQHTNLYRTPSSSIYSDFFQGRLSSGRSGGGGHEGSEYLRELEKRRIREEILAAEEERQRAEIRRKCMIEWEMRGVQSGGGFLSSSSLMLGHTDGHRHLFQPRMLHGQLYEPVDTHTRFAMPYQEEYGGSIRRQPVEVVGLDVVPPLQRSPKKFKEIITSPPKAGDKGFIGLGNPRGPTTVSGTKRKLPPSRAGGVTTEIFSPPKKKLNEWSCAVCEVTATSERGLQDHLAGKKHQAKVADSKEIKNSPESVQIDSCEDKKPEGESAGQKFKFWCRMSNKKEMNMHKKGIKHLKNQLNRAQKSRGKAGEKSRRM